jgi:isoquinoline 1-oxidoreductase beta subunit
MNLSRRQFLSATAAVGGGLLIGFTAGRSISAAGAAEKVAGEPFTPNAFVRVDPNGQVMLTMPYVEMGQGTYTSIPMLIAEELEVDLKQVRLEHAPPDEKLYANPLLGVQATGNSNAIRGAWQPLRQAVRPREPCSCRRRQSAGTSIGVLPRASGEVHPRADGRKFSYASLLPMPPACSCGERGRSSVRRISSSSAPRPSVWTRRRKVNGYGPSMASTSGAGRG